MDTQETDTLFDATDLILLGVIGLGTAAWFSREQIKQLLFGKKPVPTLTSPVIKRETNFVKVMKEQGRQVIVFYGSQTGTAESYATRFAKECSQRFHVSCMTADIELYDLSYLDQVPTENLVVFILATYGEGDPTDNAIEFWDLITEEEPAFSTSIEDRPLTNLNYLLFGLGNKTYEHYNGVSRKVNNCLTKLGARRVGIAGEGDDDGSLEEDYLSWKETIWPSFCETLGIDENSIHSGPREPLYSVQELLDYEKEQVYFGELSERPKANAKIAYDAKRPYISSLTTKELFHTSADRNCLHVEFDIRGTNLNYNTGDHIAIWPTNNEIEVNRLASILGLTDKLDTVVTIQAIDPTASKKYPFPVPTTYRSIFRYYLEITAPISRQNLTSFIDFAPTEQSKINLLQLATDKDFYRLHVTDACRNLAQVLEFATDNNTTPGLFSTVPFDLIIETISRMQPRFYSISSSSKESPHTISATIVVLLYQPDGNPTHTVYGVNSNFLYNIHQQGIENSQIPKYDISGPRQQYLNTDGHCHKLPIHIRHSTFKLPRNSTVPIIMVGPGTGVAPFRGFIRERVFEKKSGKSIGPTLLFYGSRYESQDYLYSNEWPELFKTLGSDAQLITAFSRDQPEKIYVQHRIRQHAKYIWDLLQLGAYIYVCGDAKNMAREVNQSFIQCAIEIGCMTEIKAQEYVKTLRTTGRYQEDIWC